MQMEMEMSGVVEILKNAVMIATHAMMQDEGGEGRDFSHTEVSGGKTRSKLSVNFARKSKCLIWQSIGGAPRSSQGSVGSIPLLSPHTPCHWLAISVPSRRPNSSFFHRKGNTTPADSRSGMGETPQATPSSISPMKKKFRKHCLAQTPFRETRTIN